MESKKTSIDRLFKNGETFSFRKVNYASTKITKDIIEVKEKQADILKSAEVNLNDLKKVVFTV